jgi:hypothetical protein
MREWLLAEELFTAMHRWYQIAAFFLLGCLLGWTMAWIWPAPHRATADLLVSLDPFRAVEDRYVGVYTNLDFRFPDDYKHWQMAQLNALALSDGYLLETLELLRSQDPSWQEEGHGDLRGMLSVHWRDPGKWQLVAEARDPDRAVLLVDTWRSVILARANAAISGSQELFFLDLRLQALATEEVALQETQAALREARHSLASLHAEFGEQTNIAFTSADHTRVQALVGFVSRLQPQWEVVFPEPPGIDAPRLEVLAYLDKVITVIDQLLEAEVEVRLVRLEGTLADEQEHWRQSLHQGSGLAATMTVEAPGESAPRVAQLHSPGLGALIGGFIGILAWWMMVIIQVSRRRAGAVP